MNIQLFYEQLGDLLGKFHDTKGHWKDYSAHPHTSGSCSKTSSWTLDKGRSVTTKISVFFWSSWIYKHHAILYADIDIVYPSYNSPIQAQELCHAVHLTSLQLVCKPGCVCDVLMIEKQNHKSPVLTNSAEPQSKSKCTLSTEPHKAKGSIYLHKKN